MGTKVKKTIPEEIKTIPETVLNGNITALQVMFKDDGKHRIIIKTTNDIDPMSIEWDSMTNQQKKVCTDAWDESVSALGVEVVVEEVAAK